MYSISEHRASAGSQHACMEGLRMRAGSQLIILRWAGRGGHVFNGIGIRGDCRTTLSEPGPDATDRVPGPARKLGYPSGVASSLHISESPDSVTD